MAAPEVVRPPAGGLLPASVGHVAWGGPATLVPDDAIEAFADRVAEAWRASRANGREQGFLAYAPAQPGLPMVAEEDAFGTADAIRWHWRERDATVALSFHTHPGEDALCVPSGIDAVGALVRGDHVVYVLTMDGRLSGWRFRAPARHPRTVVRAMEALEDARRLDRPFVDFLYDAFDAMRPKLLRPAYAARVVDDGDGLRLRRAGVRGFFPKERRAGAL